MLTLFNTLQTKMKKKQKTKAFPPQRVAILFGLHYLCHERIKRFIMTTAEISAEIFRNLGVLAESENMLPRVAKYLRRLVKEQQADAALMSKEDFYGKIEKAERSIAEGKGRTFTHPDEMNAWLNAM